MQDRNVEPKKAEKKKIKAFSKPTLSLIIASLALFMGACNFLLYLFNPPSTSQASSRSLSKPSEFDTQESSLLNSPFSHLIADVSEQLGPSVVNIDIRREKSKNGWIQNLLGNQHEAGPRFGNGSGFILDTQGHILTNRHVIKGAEVIFVSLQDGRKVEAELIGTDTLTDLAVIQIDVPEIHPAELGDSSKIRTGDWVIAVGNALGFDHSVSLGIISGLGRSIPGINVDVKFLQTDAAMNPGNSGGPLINLKGEVVGINTAISGRGQNIGFAIPSNLVKRIAESLIEEGRVKRAFVGISIVNLNAENAQKLGLAAKMRGAAVTRVLGDGPADLAGVKVRDVVQKINGQIINNAEDMRGIIRKTQAGKTLDLEILRNGKLVNCHIKTRQLKEVEIEALQY